MPKDITSVYVPVKTPDHKAVAILAAVLVHIGVLGFIIYTNHTKPINEPPMQMSLVTPEQLAMIQGQAAANQQAQSAQTANTNNPTPATSPAMASVNSDLAARQAKWQRDQAAYAVQLDKQALQDQQNFNNQIKQVQMNQTAQLNNLKNIQANPEAPQPLTPPPASKLPPSQGITFNENGTEKNKGENSPNGNRGSKSVKGMTSNQYTNRIFAIINGNWSPPHNSDGNSLVAHFTISPSGDINIIEISGGNNEAFKNSLIQALNASNPLPAPPPDSYNDFADNHLTFNAHKK